MTEPQFKRGDRVYVRNSDDEPWLSATFVHKGGWVGFPKYLVLLDGNARHGQFNQIKKQ